jgi:hypothetical protein
MTALSHNNHVSSSAGDVVSPPASPSPSSSDSSRVRKERSDPIKAGDTWLQSTNKRRRYLRRGSKVSTMLVASTFEIRQSLVSATTMMMMPPAAAAPPLPPSPPPPPQRALADGSMIGTTFARQDQELSSTAKQQRQRMLFKELIAEVNDSMSLLSTRGDK